MGGVLLIMAGLVAGFVLFIVVAGRFTIRAVERSLGGPAELADFVTGTGLAPDDWTRRDNRALARLRERRAPDAEIARRKQRARRRVLRHLDRTCRNFARSTIYGDEASRRALVTRLRDIGRSWQEMDWDDFAPPGVRPGPAIEEE